MSEVTFKRSRADVEDDRGESGDHLARGRLRLVATEPGPLGDVDPARVRPTRVAGVVLWGFPRGAGRFAWVPTHEPSGMPLTVGSGGPAAATNLRKAGAMVDRLGSARWRGRPVDWRSSVEWLRGCRAARLAVLNASGFITLEQMTSRSG